MHLISFWFLVYGIESQKPLESPDRSVFCFSKWLMFDYSWVYASEVTHSELSDSIKGGASHFGKTKYLIREHFQPHTLTTNDRKKAVGRAQLHSQWLNPSWLLNVTLIKDPECKDQGSCLDGEYIEITKGWLPLDSMDRSSYNWDTSNPALCVSMSGYSLVSFIIKQ